MEPSVLSRSRMMGKKTVNSRRIMAAVMVIVLLAALTGCVGKEDTQTRKKNKVVEIPMILTVDSVPVIREKRKWWSGSTGHTKGSII